MLWRALEFLIYTGVELWVSLGLARFFSQDGSLWNQIECLWPVLSMVTQFLTSTGLQQTAEDPTAVVGFDVSLWINGCLVAPAGGHMVRAIDGALKILTRMSTKEIDVLQKGVDGGVLTRPRVVPRVVDVRTPTQRVDSLVQWVVRLADGMLRTRDSEVSAAISDWLAMPCKLFLIELVATGWQFAEWNRATWRAWVAVSVATQGRWRTERREAIAWIRDNHCRWWLDACGPRS